MTAKPFVKWAGGKQAHAQVIGTVLPKKINTYFEPFLGGGAVFFHLANTGRFRAAVLSDVCEDLIDTFRAVKETYGKKDGIDWGLRHYEKVYYAKSEKSLEHAEAFFLKCRGQSTKDLSLAERGARFVFLNKTCFNGLYRVNAKGKFNVSFGKNLSPKIYDKENLARVSALLKNTELLVMHYVDALELADKGDAVYLDPPYFQVKETSFVGYSANKFTDVDHAMLGREFRKTADRGVTVVQSNADVTAIRKIYEGFDIQNMQHRRSISARPEGRKKMNDLLIVANGACYGNR